MLKTRYAALALVTTCLWGLAAQAAETPISAFPKDTGVIVRLKNPQKTLQKAGDLAVKVDRKEGMKVQLGTPMLGSLISNPSLKGVDVNSDWWLGVFPVENADPGVVFCIPATDADAMQQSVMGDYQFQKFEKWVIYTEHEATAAKLKEHLAAKGDSISTLLDKPSTALWDEGDLSVFLNVPQLLKVYRGPFDQGVEQANTFIEQFPAMVPPQQGGVDMKAIADMYASLFQGLVQAVKDAEGCTAALAISDDGISLSEYAAFSADSATAKRLASHKPSALEMLNQLPANRLAYGAAEIDMGAVVRWGMKFSLQMFAEGDTEKETQMKKLMAEYEKIEFQAMAMAFGLGNPKQGAVRMATIMEVDQPEKVRKLSEEVSKIMSEYNVGGMKMKMTYKPAAETYGDLKADVTRVKYKIDPQQNPFHQMQSKMNEILYGPEGMVTRTIYLKDRMVQSIGGGKAEAQAILDALDGKNAVGGQASYQAARKQLLPQANIIGLLDLPAAIAGGMELAIQSGTAVPFTENDAKTIRGESSFLGFSVATEKNGLRAKTIVPLKQMQGVARFVRKIEEVERQQGQ